MTIVDDPSQLILVKHAQPEIIECIPSAQWKLSDPGRASCRPLASRLAEFEPDLIVTSVEPKASETGQIVAQLLGIPCETFPDLHENDRTGLGYLSTGLYEERFRQFFSQPCERVVGHESAHAAADRFRGAVDGVLRTHPHRTIAIVTHGTVISLFIQRVTGQDPFPLWRRLESPSFVVLRRPDLIIERIVEKIR